MQISIIIPAFNERYRLPPFLSDLTRDISKLNLDAEIIIVDDGSAPEDYLVYQEASRKVSRPLVTVLRNDKNLGKGAAIRLGFKAARGVWIGFVDADGSISSREVARIITIALSSAGLDGILSSRVKMLGYTIERKLIRHVCGRLFTTLAYFLLGIPVYDSQCGCKFFRRDKILPFLASCRENGYLFDVELTAIGYLKGLNFIEAPISWKDTSCSKVKVVKDGLKMAAGIWRIRRHLISMGYYTKNKDARKK
jgi:dolichyl-phosphate beta-glucosyltransferase